MTEQTGSYATLLLPKYILGGKGGSNQGSGAVIMLWIVKKIIQIKAMTPNARKWGLRYYWDIDFRDKCRKKDRNRKATLRGRTKYGSFIGNRRKIKEYLFWKNGNICFWCGGKMKFKETTIDHIVPVSVKKDNSIKNLRLIHDKCRVERDKAIKKGIIK